MDQIQEYETQLADVEALLQATPDDPSLLSLKSDLVELLTITRDSLSDVQEQLSAGNEITVDAAAEEDTTAASAASTSLLANVPVASPASTSAYMYDAAIDDALKRTEAPTDAATAATEEPPRKKLKKLKDFVVPEHLIPAETDTDAEKNRKRRALKALKNKYRERKKEVMADQKQKSWQAFHKKKTTKSKDSKSIFSTQDGRSMTEFAPAERQRHK
jgi:hypothetical protein